MGWHPEEEEAEHHDSIFIHDSDSEPLNDDPATPAHEEPSTSDDVVMLEASDDEAEGDTVLVPDSDSGEYFVGQERRDETPAEDDDEGDAPRPHIFDPTELLLAAAKLEPDADDEATVKKTTFPRIEVYNFKALIKNQYPKQIKEWAKKKNAILASVSGRGIYDYGRHDVNEKAINGIRATLQSDTPIAVPATPAQKNTRSNEDPVWFQVQNLTREQARKLEELGGIFVEGFHVGFVPWRAIPTRLIGAWHECDLPDMSDDFLLGLFRSALRRSDEAQVMRTLIRQELQGGTPASISRAVESRFRDILESMSVRVLKFKNKDQVTHPVVVLYMDAPTVDAIAWEALRERIRANIRPGNANTGTLEYYKDSENWKCRTCHGADHPSGFCKVPDIPGWRDPATVIAAFKGEPRAPPTTKRTAPDDGKKPQAGPSKGRRGREGKPTGNGGRNPRDG